MSCKNLDSRSEKKKDKRNENSKSWYENETSNTDSLPQKKTSLNLAECNLEKTSFDKIPAEESITVQTRNVNKLKAKLGSKEEGSGQLRQRPATPQADRAKQLKMEWLNKDLDYTRKHDFPSKGLFIQYSLIYPSVNVILTISFRFSNNSRD